MYHSHCLPPPPISLIENAQRHFQGPLLGCFKYVPYTALMTEFQPQRALSKPNPNG